MIGALDDDLALGPLSDLGRRYFSLHIDCFLDESPGILLNEHELDHV